MFRWHPWTLLLMGAVSMGSVAQAQDDMLPPGDLPEPEYRAPAAPLAKEGVWLPSRAWYGATNPPVGQATGGSYAGGTHIGSPYNWSGPGSAPVGANGGTFGWNGNGWNGYGSASGTGGYGWNTNGYGGNGYGYGWGESGYGQGQGSNCQALGAGTIPGPGTGLGSGGAGSGNPNDPYVYHFGPGFHRHSNYGHYRFPYYNYRAPWYFSGSPSYHRDTNHPW